MHFCKWASLIFPTFFQLKPSHRHETYLPATKTTKSTMTTIPTPGWTALTWRSTPPHRLSPTPLHHLQSQNSGLLPPWAWVLKTYRGWSSISTDRVIRERSRKQMIIDLTNSTSTSWHPDLVGGLPAGPTLTLWEFSEKSETLLFYSFYIHTTFSSELWGCVNTALQVQVQVKCAESLRNLVAITLPCPTKAKPTKTTIIINSMSFLEKKLYDHDG